MSKPYIAKKYAMGTGVGVSGKRLPSFDKALLKAGVGNYNLVRLSSILPAECEEVDIAHITDHVREGSLLPTAYATITSDVQGEKIASAIGVGLPEDVSHVGVIMEYSGRGISGKQAEETVSAMIDEAFYERGWLMRDKRIVSTDAVVTSYGSSVTTFACIAEW